MKRIKKTVASTSSKISGQPTPIAFKDISPKIIKSVDYVVNLKRNIYE